MSNHSKTVLPAISQQFHIGYPMSAEPQFTVDQPQFKFCKKRKEFFSNEYDPIWYKSPYKYNMRMKITSSKNCLTDDLFTRLVVTHDDGTPVKFKGETITFSHPTTTATATATTTTIATAAAVNTQQTDSESEEEKLVTVASPVVRKRVRQSAPTCHHELKVGPFQFNVCSYKFDGKKFRLSIHVFQKLTSASSATEKEVCVLTSPAFLIKAKKPIAKPGIKSNKRNFDEMNNGAHSGEFTPSSPTSPSAAAASTNAAPANAMPTSPSTSMAAPTSGNSSPSLMLPNSSFYPNHPYFFNSLESYEMQKQLLESQLYQFGYVLNNLMSQQQTGAFSMGPSAEMYAATPSPYSTITTTEANKRQKLSSPSEYSTEVIMNPSMVPQMFNQYLSPSPQPMYYSIVPPSMFDMCAAVQAPLSASNPSALPPVIAPQTSTPPTVAPPVTDEIGAYLVMDNTFDQPNNLCAMDVKLFDSIDTGYPVKSELIDFDFDLPSQGQLFLL